MDVTNCLAALDLLCPLEFDFPLEIHLPYNIYGLRIATGKSKSKLDNKSNNSRICYVLVVLEIKDQGGCHGFYDLGWLFKYSNHL